MNQRFRLFPARSTLLQQNRPAISPVVEWRNNSINSFSIPLMIECVTNVPTEMNSVDAWTTETMRRTTTTTIFCGMDHRLPVWMETVDVNASLGDWRSQSAASKSSGIQQNILWNLHLKYPLMVGHFRRFLIYRPRERFASKTNAWTDYEWMSSLIHTNSLNLCIPEIRS